MIYNLEIIINRDMAFIGIWGNNGYKWVYNDISG